MRKFPGLQVSISCKVFIVAILLCLVLTLSQIPNVSAACSNSTSIHGYVLYQNGSGVFNKTVTSSYIMPSEYTNDKCGSAVTDISGFFNITLNLTKCSLPENDEFIIAVSPFIHGYSGRNAGFVRCGTDSGINVTISEHPCTGITEFRGHVKYDNGTLIHNATILAFIGGQQSGEARSSGNENATGEYILSISNVPDEKENLCISGQCYEIPIQKNVTLLATLPSGVSTQVNTTISCSESKVFNITLLIPCANNSDCSPSRYCDINQSLSSGVCREKKQPNMNCSEDYECLSEICVGNPGSCGECLYDTNCTETQFCDNTSYTCEAKKANNTVCSYDHECLSNNCLKNTGDAQGFCKPSGWQCDVPFINCTEDKYCTTNHVCESKKDNGTPCTSDEQCICNFCNNSFCGKMPEPDIIGEGEGFNDTVIFGKIFYPNGTAVKNNKYGGHITLNDHNESISSVHDFTTGSEGEYYANLSSIYNLSDGEFRTSISFIINNYSGYNAVWMKKGFHKNLNVTLTSNPCNEITIITGTVKHKSDNSTVGNVLVTAYINGQDSGVGISNVDEGKFTFIVRNINNGYNHNT